MQSKIPYLADKTLEHRYLFIALTETWLADHNDAELAIKGYKLFRSDRKGRVVKRGRHSGGVAMYIRDDLATSIKCLLRFSNSVIETLVLYSSKYNLCLIVMYRQPDNEKGGHPCNNPEFVEAINAIKKTFENFNGQSPDILMCGDFNLPRIAWPAGLPTTGAGQQEKLMSSELQSLANELFLNQMIRETTHKDGNILDLVFTNNTDIFHSYTCSPTDFSISHHYLIDGILNYCINDEVRTPERQFLNTLQSLNFFSEHTEWDSIEEALLEVNWELEFSNCSPNHIFDKFINICEEITLKHTPSKNLRSVSKQLIPKQRRKLMRTRRRINKQLLKASSANRKSKLFNDLINIEKELQLSHKIEASNAEYKAVKAIKKNPKYFFSYANKFRKTFSKIGPLLDSTSEYTSDPKEMANLLRQQYASVFSTPLDDFKYDDICENNLSDVDFTKEDIIEAINELAPAAAAGPDGFPALLLKKCKHILAHPLYLLWRKSLDTGTIPQLLLLGHIIPIHKGGDHGLPVNYRPVTLTSHCIKIFEKVIRKNIVKHLDENNLFNKTQHGFRAGRSCLSQLLEHHDKILRYLEQGFNVDTIYLDFSKAFDKVDLKVLLKKIHAMGIRGKLYHWIKSFLCQREQAVIVNGVKSDIDKVISGVPQGTVNGPLFFLIMLFDIDEDLKHSLLSSFADDTRLFKEISSTDDVTLLQNDLDSVYKWARRNNMSFNSTKFEHMPFGRDSDLKSSSNYVTDTGKNIDKKQCVKDLGVLISSDASFHDHILDLTEKCKSLSSWIFRTFATREPSVMITLWRSLVVPKLDYCSQLWNPSQVKDIQQLELIQRQFLKKIHGAKELSYWDQLKRFKTYSLQRRRERYIIIYTWKMLENLVPNIPVNDDVMIKSYQHIRRGRLCILRRTKRSPYTNIRHSFFTQNGPRLFNLLPPHIRRLTNCSIEEFKKALDEYLKDVPDEPQIPGYTSCRRADTNSLLDMIKVRGTDEYGGGHPWKPGR